MSALKLEESIPTNICLIKQHDEGEDIIVSVTYRLFLLQISEELYNGEFGVSKERFLGNELQSTSRQTYNSSCTHIVLLLTRLMLRQTMNMRLLFLWNNSGILQNTKQG
jgi:hypothetical protein